MTTAEEGSTPTALDLLFGRNAAAAAAETLASEISSLGGGQDLGRALAHLPETDHEGRRAGGGDHHGRPAASRPDRRARARVTARIGPPPDRQNGAARSAIVGGRRLVR